MLFPFKMFKYKQVFAEETKTWVFLSVIYKQGQWCTSTAGMNTEEYTSAEGLVLI